MTPDSRTRTTAPPRVPTCARFRVHLLGPLVIARDEAELDARQWPRWVDSLLVILATSPGHRRHREEIIDALWPEAAPQAGASDLRYILHLLRRSLGGGIPSPVLSERGWLALNPAYTWEIDLERFEALITSEETDDLLAAAALHQGDPLHAVRYQDWAGPLRERLRQEWRALCRRLARHARARGAGDDVLRWLDRALEDDPLDEEVVEEALEVLAEAERLPEALRRYQAYAEHLRQELGIAPGPRVRALAVRCEVAPNAPPPPRPPHPTPSYPLPRDGRFVGREAELRSALDRGERDAPRLLLVAGVAGVGKTRLLAEVAERARGAGTLVLAGGCYEQEDGLPYGPFHDALLDLLQAWPEPDMRAALGELLPDLLRIVPELRARGAARDDALPREGGDDERLRLFTAVARVLERLAGEGRLLLVLDDLQWADRGSIQLMHFLLRQGALARVEVIASYRDDEPLKDAPLAALLAELRRAGDASSRARHITLTPLDANAIAALLHDRLRAPSAGPLTELIARASGGNPFFALQMLALLREEGRIERTCGECRLRVEAAAGEGMELPPSVRETVSRRLQGLAPRDLRVLWGAAVLGRECRYETLAAVWCHDNDGGGEDALCAALDVVLDARLLQEARGGYMFPQPVLREVVYTQIPLHRQRQLHRHAGHALRQLARDREALPVAELARHFTLAGEAGEALPYAIAAGDQAWAAYQHEEAERQYRAALDLAQGVGAEPRVEAELLLKLGRVLRLTPQRDEAVVTLERAASVCHALGDVVAEGLALATLAKTYHRNALPQQSHATLARAEALGDALAACAPTPELVAVYSELGTLYFGGGRYVEALAARERAWSVADALGDERLRVRTEAGKIIALAMLGHLSQAGAAARQLIPRAEAAGDREALRLALAQTAEAALMAGRFVESRAHRERELEVASQLGATTAAPFACSNLAQVTLYLGEWEATQRYAERALSGLRDIGSLARTSYPLAFLGELALRRGNWKTAVAHLEQAVALADSSGDLQALRYAQRLLAEWEVLASQPARAVARIEPLLDRPGLEEHDVTALLPTLAWAALRLGDGARAAELAVAAMARATTQGNQLALQDALRVRGLLLAAQGRTKEADGAFAEAVRLASAMPYPYAEALARAEWGALLLQAGERARAAEALRRAAALFGGLGATRDERGVRSMLARLG